jgi:hydroxysqualene dehydroxylase
VSAAERVVVVGGGLAGITAALDCAEAGAQVTLLEVRRRLGGAAYSFERDGLQMDNGQHVFLRCCVAYRALLERLGSTPRVSVQPRLRIPVLKPGARPAELRRGELPAPLHLSGALLRYPHLSLLERAGAARAALALKAVDPDDPRNDGIAFGAWLARHGQGAHAVAALWDLIALPTLNLPAAEASLALAAFVFQTGLLASADAADIGFHDATLQETIGGPALGALTSAGVEVRLGWRAERLVATASGFEVHGRTGSEELAESPAPFEASSTPGASAKRGAMNPNHADGIEAGAVVVALPHNRAESLLAGALRAPRPARPELLGSSPIVNLHVVYDRQVLEQPFAAGVGTPVQYLFDRSAAAGAPAGCQYLAVSLSGAEREMGMSVEQLRERYLPALAELLPRARGASVERFLLTREHAATFRAAPGVGALRPGARTDRRGLALAGTWTATGWPATLESAVLSGHRAADVVLADLGVPSDSSPLLAAGSS